MTLRELRPVKNLERLVQDGELRLKRLLELSDQINKLVEEHERELPGDQAGSALET